MDATRTMLALGLVLSLLAGALWALRRGGRPVAIRLTGLRLRAISGKKLRRVEALGLTQHHQLHLVEWDGRSLLIATHPSGASLVFQPARDFGGEFENAVAELGAGRRAV
jgi:hypothetical protein